MLSRFICFAAALVAVATLFPSESSAQLRRPLRWLGEGYSDGYHRCNPGPNSDYYNPYNAHNSYLISKDPRFQQPVQPQNQQIRYGVPYSVYAAPMHNASFGHANSQTLTPSPPPSKFERESINWQPKKNQPAANEQHLKLKTPDGDSGSQASGGNSNSPRSPFDSLDAQTFELEFNNTTGLLGK